MQISKLPAPQQALAKYIDAHPSIGSKDDILTVEEVITALQLGLVKPEDLPTAQLLREQVQAEAMALGVPPAGSSTFVSNPTSASAEPGAPTSSVGGLTVPVGSVVWPGLVEDDLDDEVDTSLLDEDLTKIGASASGEVFQLDSATVGAMTVRVRQIVDSVHGPGSEISARLTLRASKSIAEKFTSQAVEGATQLDFAIEAADFTDGAAHLKQGSAYVPQIYGVGSLKAFRLEEPGKWTVDYVQPHGMPQTYRDKLRIRVFGATDAERDQNLLAAVQRCGVPGMVADADSLQMERMRRLSALRMVAPARAEELAKSLDTVELSTLDQSLAEVGIDAARLADIDFEEVFPGHMAAVDPKLGEAYAKLGVRMVMVGVRQLDSVVRILTSDGLMSSENRYSRGLHRPGASLAGDELSGGAEFAFTRLITQRAIDEKATIGMSFGAGECQLLSLGDQMEAQLSRTDWHAYPNDNFGSSISKTQIEADPDDTRLAQELGRRKSQFSARLVLSNLVDAINGVEAPYNPNKWQTSNEACFKAGVPAAAFIHAVVATETAKRTLIQLLQHAGVEALGDRPLTEAILVATNWEQVGSQLGFPPGTPPNQRRQAIAAVDQAAPLAPTPSGV